MLMKKIRFSLPIILGFIGFLNMIQFFLEFDISFLSSSLKRTSPSFVIGIIVKSYHEDLEVFQPTKDLYYVLQSKLPFRLLM